MDLGSSRNIPPNYKRCAPRFAVVAKRGFQRSIASNSGREKIGCFAAKNALNIKKQTITIIAMAELGKANA